MEPSLGGYVLFELNKNQKLKRNSTKYCFFFDQVKNNLSVLGVLKNK